jgi:glutamate dehydrogenase (NADP+)
VERNAGLDHQPMWDIPADCAFPCATQNELTAKDARNLLKNKVILVCEGADMPCDPEAVDRFLDAKILYAPGKAANAGGVAVSALEMAQNSMRLNWPRQEVDDRLKTIMKNIHQTCLEAAEEYGFPGNYLAGANIAGFVKVVDAMLDQGVI